MSQTTITNLSNKEFVLHKHVLAPHGTLTLDDSELKGDWEILRPLNYAASGGDITTSGAVSLPDWVDYPGGVSETDSSTSPVFNHYRGAKFVGFR